MTFHASNASLPCARPLAVGLALALALPVAGAITTGFAAPVRDVPVHRSPMPSAATLPVTSCADDGSAGTLRSVVAGAASGDTVDLSQLSCSTITLTQGEITVAQDDLTLSGPGAANLSISGGDASGVLAHHGTGTLSIDALSVVAGHASHAGGCVYSSGSVDANGTVVSGCTTGVNSYLPGGGLYVKGNVGLTHSTVANNYGYKGGGVWTMGELTVTSSTVSNNSAYMGGGLWTHGKGMTLAGSTISGNAAGFNSGGVLAYSESGTWDGKAVITNSTISGNTSGKFIGGIYVANMEVHMSNSTIAFNRASTICSGLLIGGHHVYSAYMDSSVLANNVSASGTQCDFSFPTLSVNGAHNLIVASNSILPPDTLRTDPLLQPLADNGGPTQTHALTAGSPAIDTGSNLLGLAFDQRGQGFARVHGSAADIGAFEVQQSAAAVSVTKLFLPNAVRTNGLSTLTITLSNGGTSPATLTSALTDALPASIVVANPPNATTTCASGTVAATAAAGSVTLNSGAQIPANGSCTVSVSVIAHAVGTFTNVIPAGALQTDAGSSADPATADLGVSGVAVVPTVSKAFAPSTIVAGQTSVLTITFANSAPNAATLTADLADNLPVSLVVASPANATTTCPGGTVTAAAGATAVILGSGAQIPGGTCTVSVAVTAASAGAYLNTIPAGALQTDFGSNPDAARAGLTVTPAGPTDRIFADGFDG
jgi:hypothetical protein